MRAHTAGSYSRHTYGSNPRQACAPQAETARSADHKLAVEVVRLAGVAPLLIWDISTTQWDMHLARKTPYVRDRVDCTHWCEPSGVMEAWVDALLVL